MEKYERDLLRNLEWLDWTQQQHLKGRPQEEIDRRAFDRAKWLKPELSAEVLRLYEDTIVDACGSPRLGRPEECMSWACREVVKWSTEEEWTKYIAPIMDPDLVARWRSIWEKERADMSREEEIYHWWLRESFGGPSDYRKQLAPDEHAMINDWDAEAADAHNCRACASPEGYCTECGAIIPGSTADYSEHGYDPPDWDLEM